MPPRLTQEQRQELIFDAAEALFVRHGYDKTTISDIAREAGISKGAIYLHHKSKDELFEALLLRELTRYRDDWFERLEQEPLGGTIGGIYRTVQQAVRHNPLIGALMTQDAQFFGSYLKKPDNLFRNQQTNMRATFVQMMQAAGAIRSDMAPELVAHIMNMLAYGLISMKDVMDERDIPPFDDLLDAIAEVLDRALTPPDKDTANAAGKAVMTQLKALTQPTGDGT